jgi:CHAT domain-containing protein
MAHLQQRLKNPSAARNLLLTAYAYYDLARLNTLGEDGRLWLDEEQKELIDDIVRSFIRSNEIATALAFLESNKASTLSEIIDDSAFRQAQTKWNEMQLRQTLELVKLLDGDTPHQLSSKEKVAVFIDGLVRRHREEAQELQSQLGLQSATAARSLSSEKLQEIQSELPVNVAVLSFFVQRRQSSVFVITRAGIQHIPVNLTGCECMKAAQQLRVALSNPVTDFYREPAQYLYQSLLGSVLKNLPPSVNVIVYSPDGPLARVPLAALMDGEHFVGERFAVYQVPSLRFLAKPLKHNQKSELNGLACVDPQVGDARLPAQSETGDVLQKLYGEKLVALTRKGCTSKALVGEIQKQKSPLFIHLGAQGFLYPPRKMDSGLLLSPEGESGQKASPWSAKEIAALDMSHVELVTLSTTAPGLLEYKYQRDAIGIVRPFFFGGAKRVLAPLWHTADEPAGEFMKAFYRSYAKNIPAPLSLQQAQLSLMRSEKYRHPHYWATYVLTEGL